MHLTPLTTRRATVLMRGLHHALSKVLANRTDPEMYDLGPYAAGVALGLTAGVQALFDTNASPAAPIDAHMDNIRRASALDWYLTSMAPAVPMTSERRAEWVTSFINTVASTTAELAPLGDEDNALGVRAGYAIAACALILDDPSPAPQAQMRLLDAVRQPGWSIDGVVAAVLAGGVLDGVDI